MYSRSLFERHLLVKLNFFLVTAVNVLNPQKRCFTEQEPRYELVRVHLDVAVVPLLQCRLVRRPVFCVGTCCSEISTCVLGSLYWVAVFFQGDFLGPFPAITGGAIVVDVVPRILEADELVLPTPRVTEQKASQRVLAVARHTLGDVVCRVDLGLG